MCELFALAFNEPVTAQVSFRGFRQRGAKNPDGWGLAWFGDGRPVIHKEPARADLSKTADELQGAFISSSIFIGHVRYASHGKRKLENTHPFRHDLGGRPVVLAHNGTLERLPEPTHFSPCGETDSEQALCVLLSWMKEEGVGFSDFAWIESRLRELNRYGSMNMLFSNGKELFAYRDMNGHTGLCLTRREAPFRKIRLHDEDWVVDLTQEKKPSERGFVIATRPLTVGEDWTDLQEGRLLVIRRGTAVYGDPRV